MIQMRPIRHLSRHSTAVIAMFVVLTLAAGMFSSMLFEQENLQRVGRGFYSDHAVFFRFTSDPEQAGSMFPDTLNAAGLTDYVVMNSVEDVRGIYIKGDPEHPPIKQGRFLTQEDCVTEEPCAVVGSDRWSEVMDPDGTQMINILGQDYTVIGEMGTEYPSAINELVMVNLFSMPPDLRASGRLLVDGQNPGVVYGEIENNFVKAIGDRPEEMGAPMDALQALMFFGGGSISTHLRSSYLFVLITIMLLSCAILMTEWIRRQTRSIAILRLVGVSNGRIFRQIIQEFLMLALVGIILAVGVMWLLSRVQLFQTHTDMIRQGMWTGAFSLVSGLFVVLPVLLHATRVDVVKILR